MFMQGVESPVMTINVPHPAEFKQLLSSCSGNTVRMAKLSPSCHGLQIHGGEMKIVE